MYMKDYAVSKEKIAELEKLYRSLRDKRQADRVKAVIALSRGWSAKSADFNLRTTHYPLRTFAPVLLCTYALMLLCAFVVNICGLWFLRDSDN
jgi:type VI protein secretion system component VasF